MTEIAWIGPVLQAARARALAALLRQFESVELAEEAFQEASLRALATWPDRGPPRDPLAWLIQVGRNAAVDSLRRRSKETALPDEIAPPIDGDQASRHAEAMDAEGYGDDLLRLLFICCHRDLPRTQQIPLALRVVSGLTVPQIARAFLVSEAAMAQRLTRARRTIAAAAVPFETPSPAVRAERLSTVLGMLYLMFNQGYGASALEAEPTETFCAEAVRLTRALLELFPDEPEVLGLLGLMLLQDSRAEARFDEAGDVITIEDQDRALWDRAKIAEGTELTNRAFALGRPGPYQVQAAIAALHARAPSVDQTDWRQIEFLYRALLQLQPSPVVELNHAVAVSRVFGAGAGLEVTERLEPALRSYFYFHAVRGHLLERLDRVEEARAAYSASLGLAASAAEAAMIRTFLDRLKAVSSALTKAT